MNGIDLWLKQASRRLSAQSAAQVAGEIRAHYESARDAALAGGADAVDADRSALAALGDPRAANREYRKVLLTKTEARLLRQGSREARFICARRGSRVVFLSIPGLVLLASAALFLTGSSDLARTLSRAGIWIAALLLLHFLPIYTPSRSRFARYAKWLILAALPLVAFGSGFPRYSWLLISCLWPVALAEWTRVSLRRKLPIARWPKDLYL